MSTYPGLYPVRFRKQPRVETASMQVFSCNLSLSFASISVHCLSFSHCATLRLAVSSQWPILSVQTGSPPPKLSSRLNKPQGLCLQPPLSLDLTLGDQHVSCNGVPKLSTVSRCGVTTIRQRRIISSLNLLAVLLLIQPRMLLSTCAARAGCRLTPSSLSAQDPCPVDRAAP